MMSKKLFIPRKLNIHDSRYTEHNNSQPMVDGKRINQYNIDGNKTGYWEYYYNNGQLSSKGSYVDGKEEGYWETYYENGKLESKGSYKNGENDGYLELYYSNGKLMTKGNYKDGKEDGYWESYFYNGELHYKGSYKDGERDGNWEEYHSNGNLWRKGSYKDNELIEKLSITEGKKLFIPRKLNFNDSRYSDHNNAQPIKDGVRINQYDIDGNKQGYWEGYYPNGKLESKGSYNNGKKDGYWVWYHSNGKLDSKGNYVDGLRDGYWEYYYDNGKLDSKGSYKNGKREGYWEAYYDNGELELKWIYKDGKKDGYCETYNDNGGLMYKGIYKNGELIQESPITENKKIFIPRKLSNNDSRYTEHNNAQPMVDGLRINQYDIDGNKTGYWEEYFSNGELDFKGSYKNGLRDGYWVEYYSSGNLWFKGSYKDDLRDGYWEWYHNNGKLHSKGNYKDDKEDGYWEYYYYNGKLDTKGNLINGKADGYWESYWGNGQLESKGRYKDGKRYGYWEWYYYYGKLHSKGSYIDGKRDGIWEEYWDNGKLSNKGSYKNGIKEEYLEEYHSNSQLWMKGNNKVGNLVENLSTNTKFLIKEEIELIREGNLENYLNNIVSKIQKLPYQTKKKYLTIAISTLLGYTSYPIIQSMIDKSPDKEIKTIAKEIVKDSHKTDKVSLFKDGTTLRLSSKGYKHIVDEEKPRLVAYALGDGKITIGYGHAENIETTKLKVGQKISKSQAEQYLKKDLKIAADGVRRILKSWKLSGDNYKVTQDMFDAMVSMAFNMGVGNLRQSAVIHQLKLGHYKKAGKLIKQTNINPEKFPGLEIRRDKESNMFLSYLTTSDDIKA
jgi:uncharacterized protein